MEHPPLLEKKYTFEDALVIVCALNTLINNADRVKIACLAQLVNVLAPIMTEDQGTAWEQTIYWPFYYCSRYGKGNAVDISVDVPCYENSRHGSVPYIDASAVLSEDQQELTFFLVNRHQEERIPLTLQCWGFDEFSIFDWVELAHTDLQAENTKDNPGGVFPKQKQVQPGEVPVLAPVSWNMVHCRHRKS